MKKILYLITSSEYGGAQKYVFDLASNLPQAEYQAIVAAGNGDGELFSRLADFPTVKTVKILNLKRLPGPLTAWRCLKEIIKLLIQEKPDVLHLNSSMAGCLGSWAAKVYKKNTKASLKVAYTVHGWMFLEPGFLKSQIYLLAEKITAKWKDAFIVLSERDLKIGVRKKIAPKNKFVKIYNGLNDKAPCFLTKETARKILPAEFQKDNLPVIGTIANFYHTKGLQYLIEAARLLKEKNKNINFIIFGDGPEKKKLEKQIAESNLEKNIFLAGRIPSAAQYLAAFDIFVLPSVKEGLPYAILEAMAAGLPIVATNVGGIPELIENNVSGILVELKNPTAMAKAIENLVRDEDKQKNLAKNARRSIERFSLKSMLFQTLALYKD